MKKFYCTYVYTQNRREERKELWRYLNQWGVRMQKPCLILGDFNNVLHSDDKIRGATVTLNEVKDFQECLRTCLLEEMGRKGQHYIWNNKGKINRVFYKIDWSFINGK